MRVYFLLFIFLTLLLLSCTSARIANYQFNQKTAAPQLQQDVVLLKKILETNHPSLYWYTPKDSMDAYFNNVIATIKDSLTEVQFRNKVASVISKIRCGHTAVRFSKNYTKVIEQNRYPAFPLSIKTWGDSMVVLSSLFPWDTIFKRGVIITSINNKTNKQLLDSMFQLVSTDGYSDNFKSQVFSSNFPAWYKLAFGVDSVYTVGLIDSLGNHQSVTIKNFTLKKEVVKSKRDTGKIQLLPPPIITEKPSRHYVKKQQLLTKRSLNIDNATQTAYLRVATFSNGKLRSFFRRSLKTIHHQSIKNVIIDLRENTGGKLNSSTLLTKYFTNKPFKTGDTIAAITKRIYYKKYMPQAYPFWFAMQTFSGKKEDGRYHKRKEETHYYKPKQTNHFEGNIYLLQGGYTFSAATLFVTNLKGQKNVTVVGEETGGGYYGNTALFLPTIVLPNSKLRVVLPLARLVVDSTRLKNGHGIMPDVFIPPLSTAIKNGVDFKMTVVNEMIAKRVLLSSTSN